MNHDVLVYCGSFFLVVWGIAHLFPTRSVIRGFGNITIDNKRIIAMEWIGEGTTLIFIGLLVALVTITDPSSAVSRIVFWSSFGILNVMSAVSLCTGFRIPFIVYKLCPIIFTGSSVLILVGGVLF
jgi:hypothetical protein